MGMSDRDDYRKKDHRQQMWLMSELVGTTLEQINLLKRIPVDDTKLM